MNTTLPEHSFLKQVKELCEKNGTVLIFDEMITGFRFSKGGAQEFFGVTPDLACFGKGLANGFPLAALVGKRSLMELLEDLFFSFTFGGETLSLAAANAVLDKLDREPVVETLLKRGDHLISSLNEVIKENDATAMFSIQGHPSWTFLTLEDAGPYSSMEIKTLLLQKLFERGILCLGTHNLSYAHQPGDIETLVATYAAVLPELQACVNDRTLHTELRCEALTPLFTPRA
jgi:glutamate-1-semialdehyde 2,1-aminomutase